MKKKIIKVPVICLAIAVASLSFTGCGKSNKENSTTTISEENSKSSKGSETVNSTDDDSSEDAITEESVEKNAEFVVTPEYTEEELSSDYDEASVVKITLKDDTAECDSDNVTVDGGIVTITKAGVYVVTGTLTDGRIVVNSEDKEIVRIVLAGVEITSSDGSAIFVENAEETIVTLKADTENVLSDAEEYSQESQDSKMKATIYSKDDLTINGEGTLKVNANYNHGIQSKDDLLLISGKIEVESVGNAIVGKDSVIIKEADITIDSEGKGIKGTSTKAEKGYVYVENARLDITAEDDGIHSDTVIQIDGGDITISSSDDGIHADVKILINDGKIDITDSYEGIEATIITMNDGDVNINSSDDGINASNGLSSGMGGFGNMKGGMDRNSDDNVENFENFDKKNRQEFDDAENGDAGKTGNADIAENGDNSEFPENMKGGKMKGQRPDMANGEMPEMSDGEMSQMPDGEKPQMANGEMPQRPDGEVSDGEMSQRPDGEVSDEEMPQMQDGEVSDGEMPQRPDGEMTDGELPDGNGDFGMKGFDKTENSSSSDSDTDKSALAILTQVFTINGGTLHINAGGDGLDSNGDVVMTGGTIIIDGPESSADGAIDYEDTFDMSGGEIIAAGSSGMAMTPSSSSSINSVNITFTTSYSDTEIVIKDANGNEVVSYTPAKKFNSFVFGSEKLKTGETYTIYADGEETDSFTVSGTITTVGNGGGFGGGFQGNGNMGGGRR